MRPAAFVPATVALLIFVATTSTTSSAPTTPQATSSHTPDTETWSGCIDARWGGRLDLEGRPLPVAAEGARTTVELTASTALLGWASARQRSAPSSIRATRPPLSPTTHRICPPLATAVTAPSALSATGASVATQAPSRHAPQRRSTEATTRSPPTHQPLTAAAAPVEKVVEEPLSTSRMATTNSRRLQ